MLFYMFQVQLPLAPGSGKGAMLNLHPPVGMITLSSLQLQQLQQGTLSLQQLQQLQHGQQLQKCSQEQQQVTKQQPQKCSQEQQGTKQQLQKCSQDQQQGTEQHLQKHLQEPRHQKQTQGLAQEQVKQEAEEREDEIMDLQVKVEPLETLKPQQKASVQEHKKQEINKIQEQQKEQTKVQQRALTQQELLPAQVQPEQLQEEQHQKLTKQQQQQQKQDVQQQQKQQHSQSQQTKEPKSEEIAVAVKQFNQLLAKETNLEQRRQKLQQHKEELKNYLKHQVLEKGREEKEQVQDYNDILAEEKIIDKQQLRLRQEKERVKDHLKQLVLKQQQQKQQHIVSSESNQVHPSSSRSPLLPLQSGLLATKSQIPNVRVTNTATASASCKQNMNDDQNNAQSLTFDSSAVSNLTAIQGPGNSGTGKTLSDARTLSQGPGSLKNVAGRLDLVTGRLTVGDVTYSHDYNSSKRSPLQCFCCHKEQNTSKPEMAFRKAKWEATGVDDMLKQVWQDRFDELIAIVNRHQIGMCGKCLRFLQRATDFLDTLEENVRWLDKILGPANLKPTDQGRNQDKGDQRLAKGSEILTKGDEKPKETPKTNPPKPKFIIEMISLKPNALPVREVLTKGSNLPAEPSKQAEKEKAGSKFMKEYGRLCPTKISKQTEKAGPENSFDIEQADIDQGKDEKSDERPAQGHERQPMKSNVMALEVNFGKGQFQTMHLSKDLAPRLKKKSVQKVQNRIMYNRKSQHETFDTSKNEIGKSLKREVMRMIAHKGEKTGQHVTNSAFGDMDSDERLGNNVVKFDDERDRSTKAVIKQPRRVPEALQQTDMLNEEQETKDSQKDVVLHEVLYMDQKTGKLKETNVFLPPSSVKSILNRSKGDSQPSDVAVKSLTNLLRNKGVINTKLDSSNAGEQSECGRNIDDGNVPELVVRKVGVSRKRKAPDTEMTNAGVSVTKSANLEANSMESDSKNFSTSEMPVVDNESLKIVHNETAETAFNETGASIMENHCSVISDEADMVETQTEVAQSSIQEASLDQSFNVSNIQTDSKMPPIVIEEIYSLKTETLPNQPEGLKQEESTDTEVQRKPVKYHDNEKQVEVKRPIESSEVVNGLIKTSEVVKISIGNQEVKIEIVKRPAQKEVSSDRDAGDVVIGHSYIPQAKRARFTEQAMQGKLREFFFFCY